MIVKKPVWSTKVVDIYGYGTIIHNYADGSNSGPLSIYCGPPYPEWSDVYKRKVRYED